MQVVESKHPAVQYAHDVLDGKVVSGRLVRLSVEREMHDQAHAHERGLWFDHEAADRAIRWFSLCRHYDGEFAGQPLNLEPWQQWITWVTYGWKKENGYRRFRERWIEVGSGNGKTTWMAADGLLMLVGDGEAGAEIFPVATKTDQALILWNAAARMVEQSPNLQAVLDLHDSFNNHRIIFPQRHAFMVPLAREAKTSSSEGKKPHAVYCDEVHEYRNRKQYDILKKKMVKRRQPMLTSITTAGDDEPETLYEEIHDYAVEVLDGWRKDEFIDDSFFAYIARIDDDDDPYAEGITEDAFLHMIQKANPNLGVSVQVDAILDHWRRGWKVESERATLLRYSCNRRASTAVREITSELWDSAATDIDWSEFDGQPCIGAIDLSATIDLTALTLLFFRDGLWYYRFFSWLPKDIVPEACKRDLVPYDRWAKNGHLMLTPGSQIDDKTIAQKVIEIDEKYQVLQWTSDPWHTKFLVNILQREADVELVQFQQDLSGFGEPTMHFLDELRAGKMRHDGNPVARWCATNVITKEDSHGNRKPHKRASKKRIDPIVAAIMCRGRAIVLDLENPDAGGSIWETMEALA